MHSHNCDVMGATTAGSTYNDLPKILNQTIGTKFNVITGYEGTSKILLGMRSREIEGGCWGWESARVTARAMLDAKGEDQLIPIIIHRKWEDPLVSDLPLIPEIIKAKADKDGLAVYKAWADSMNSSARLWRLRECLKDRLEILRKGYAAIFKDKEFLAEAEKVSAEEIYRHVNDTLDSPRCGGNRQEILLRRRFL